MTRADASLPIDAVLPALRASLQQQANCVLVAQPGAGKTTRVPLALLTDTPDQKRWLLLEPRRIAARLAAGFMAEQLGERVGETVGYRVRGDSQVSANTRIEVVTQGILTRILQDDPTLDGIAGLIFDEFHERSLDADLGLALALDVQQGLRPDLRILVMSATLDTDALLRTLGETTPIIDCPGQSWPVTTAYRPAPTNNNRHDNAASHQTAVIREALSAQDGDVLVFLPGQAEIRRLQRQLDNLAPDIDVHALHGQLPLAEQQQVLRGSLRNRRRVILSTAIAESSVTVPGVRIVVDAGRERVPVFQPRSGLTRLDTRTVNRASADQRRGRAGRQGPGLCYRLWSQEQVLTSHREAEMLQSDLSSLVFELARWGVTDVSTLRWMTPPPAAALSSCRDMLLSLDLLEPNGSLTVLGQRCAEWPTHPRFALMLEFSRQQSAMVAAACWLVAWLEERPGESTLDMALCLASRPRQQTHGSAGRWRHMAQQWARRMRCQLDDADLNQAPALLARGFPERIAQNQGDGRFKLASGGQALLPEHHALRNQDLLVAIDLDGQASAARVFHAIAISRDVLLQTLPAAAVWQDRVYWDDRSGQLIAEQQQRLGELVLATRQPVAGPGNLSPDVVSRALLEALRRNGLPWTDDDRALMGRLRLLHKTLGKPWPEVTDEALHADLENWLLPHLSGLRRLDQVKRLPLSRLFVQSLDWALQAQLDQLVPTHLQVPSGSSIRLDYSGDEPVLAVKLQEMFGQTDTPTIINGRVPLLIHLLSPARRPVQVTRDLAGFWAGSYFEVRKDLRGRYPKHPWPDDPLQAPATRFTKKR